MDEHVDKDEHSGPPSTSTPPESIAKVREAILADHRQTIHDVCEIVGLSYGTTQRILADNLNMRCISARFVPRLLSDNQKALCVSVCRELKQQARDNPNFISNIVTGDETWVYGYDPATKQSSQWKLPNSPQPKKACQVCSNVKSILIIFFNIQGTVYKEFVPPGQIVNGNFHCEVLKRLREGIWRKRPDKWKKNNWFLHQDNAPAHTSFAVRQFLTSKNITVIPHPPYSPDLAPCEFFLFPNMKLQLKGRHFDTTEEIHADTQEVIDTNI